MSSLSSGGASRKPASSSSIPAVMIWWIRFWGRPAMDSIAASATGSPFVVCSMYRWANSGSVQRALS